MAKPTGTTEKKLKSADARRESATHKVGQSNRKPAKKQTPAALLTAPTVSILDKAELMEHCSKGTLVSGHQFRIKDNDGTHADFEVGTRGESHVYIYTNGNAPEFSVYSGYKGIFIYPQFPLMDNFVSKMDGPAAELQEAIVDYIRENLNDDERRLLAGQLPKEKPSLDLGPMFAGTPGLYGIDDKVGFRLFDDGNLKVVFVSRELEGDEWSALHGIVIPMWKLAKNAEEFKAFNETFDKFSEKKTLTLALGKKLLAIAEAANITIAVAKVEEKKEKAKPESNSDMSKLFACIDDRYAVEDGKVGLRAFSSSGDIAVIYVENGYKGPWENLFHTRVNIANLANDAEKFKAFGVEVTKESDSEQKSLALGKLLLALAVAGKHEIKAPVKLVTYVGNTDMVNTWGKATSNLLDAFANAVSAEYTENKSVNIRIGSNPDEGMVMAVVVSKAGFTLTPVMIGSKHPLANTVEEGCYIFAEGQLPTKEMAESMGGKWKASLLPLVTYLIDEADGRKIIDPLSAGHQKLKEKRNAEKKAKAERHDKQAKLKVVTQDGGIVAPQYGKQVQLERKPIATKPVEPTPAPVATQPTGTMSEIAMKMAIDSMNGDPDKIAKFIANLNGHQAKSA